MQTLLVSIEIAPSVEDEAKRVYGNFSASTTDISACVARLGNNVDVAAKLVTQATNRLNASLDLINKPPFLAQTGYE